MAVIGILALQGDFYKHRELLTKLKVKTELIRNKDELRGIDGLILPGGESTTIGKLMARFNLLDHVKDAINQGLPVYGTCAGAILLAEKIEFYNQAKLGVLDITISRNAYGRQVDSFETDIVLKMNNNSPFRCVFIRAPIITQAGNNVEILGTYNNNPVLVRQKNILASTFHPELTDNTAVHEYFLNSIVKNSLIRKT